MFASLASLASSLLEDFSFGPSASAGQRVNASGGSLMLRTIFFMAIAIWMLGLMLQFGEGILPLLVVVASILLVMKRAFRRRSLHWHR